MEGYQKHVEPGPRDGRGQRGVEIDEEQEGPGRRRGAAMITLDRSKLKKNQYRVHPNPEWTKTRNSRISAAGDGRTDRAARVARAVWAPAGSDRNWQHQVTI